MSALAAGLTVQTRSVLDYAALDRTMVADTPFRHLVTPEFVPPDSLGLIYSQLPKLDRGGSFPPEALALGPDARALMDELEGPALRACIARKFHLDLSDAPTMLTMRLATRRKDGQIHTDSEAKRVTVLLYLNPPNPAFAQQEGCLRLLRTADNLEDYAVEVPPTRGTLLVFPNGPATFHGHRSYAGPRHSIQLNYMTDDSRARMELRRHRLSALAKRFF